MDIDLELMKNYLVEKWQYPPQQVESVILKLLKMDPAIQASFQEWFASGKFPTKPVYSGLNPKSLAKAYPFKAPAVFLLLEWVRTEPEAALNALVEEYRKPPPKGYNPGKKSAP